MDDLLPEILEGFVAEARSYIAGLCTLLDREEQGASRPEEVQEGYRLLHCLRGAAAMLGLAELAEHATPGEAMLAAAAGAERRLEAGERQALQATLARLTAILDILSAELAASGGGPDPAGAGEAFDLSDLDLPGEPAEEEPARSSPGGAAGTLPDDLVDSFYEEAEEHLAAIGAALRTLARDPGAAEALRETRQRLHTLKGAASMMGLAAVARICHDLEDSLERPDPDLQPLQAGLDSLEDLLRRPAPAAPSPAAPSAPAASRNRRPAAESVRVPLERVDELVRHASDLLVERSVFELAYGELTRQTGELALSLRRLRNLAAQLEREHDAIAGRGQADLAPAGRALRTAAGTGAEPEFDALEMDRYTDLHLLTSGLGETVSDVETVAAELTATASDFEGILVRNRRLIRGLQERLLRLRAVPLASLAGRLHRAVRDAAGRTGKRVDLTFEGESVELDKSLLDALAEPLLHLVRNAVDHGIEPLAERQARSKPEAGSLRVTARYQGGQAVIEVADDGGGVDLAAVRTAAASRGLISPEAAAGLTDADARDLLFFPGFSTAASLSEVSGRGLGLDIVRSRVESLRGSVALDSQPGAGTRFTLRLPLSLAVTRALLVRAAGQVLALPGAAVMRVSRLDRAELQADAEGWWVRMDGAELPVRTLGEALGLPEGPGGPELAARPLALEIDAGDHREVVLIEELVENREVVVKPLGPLLRRVPGLAGATLLGDGSVVPILDPYTLPDRGRPALPASPPAARAAARLEVLIVDDSLSVRRVLSNLATNAGWVPSTARDGLEALQLLQQLQRPPDVVLLDVEMPRMDGYELAATLRAQPAHARLPIVMITSRAGPKHREKALASGASHYLVKPFDPEVLVALVERLAADARIA